MATRKPSRSRRAVGARRFQVIAEGLRLRSGPATSYGILTQFSRGEKILGWPGTQQDGWMRARHGALDGWLSMKYVQALPSEATRSRFPWLAIAKGELGVQEVPGAPSEARILEYLRSTTLPSKYASTDETAWCSAFVNWCVERSGHAGTDSAWALDWLDWGVETARPSVGCIVVLRRGPKNGHVGFFLERDESGVLLLGGNQSDRVCEQRFANSKVLGFRVP